MAERFGTVAVDRHKDVANAERQCSVGSDELHVFRKDRVKRNDDDFQG